MSPENKFYVYEYLREKDSETAKAGTPYYVGKGSGKRAYTNKGRCAPRPKSDNNIIFVFQNLTEEESFSKEIELIAKYGRIDLQTGILRNRTSGGEGASNMSDESRKKISKANTGKKRSEATRKKISEVNRNRSPETRKKISKANKGRKMSEEFCKKVSEASRNRSPETLKKLSDAIKNRSQEILKKVSEANKGKKRSEASRKKMSEAAKGRKMSEATRKKVSEASRNRTPETLKKLSESRKKKISIDGVIYLSVKDACESIKITTQTFYYHIKSGKMKVEYL